MFTPLERKTLLDGYVQEFGLPREQLEKMMDEAEATPLPDIGRDTRTDEERLLEVVAELTKEWKLINLAHQHGSARLRGLLDHLVEVAQPVVAARTRHMWAQLHRKVAFQQAKELALRYNNPGLVGVVTGMYESREGCYCYHAEISTFDAVVKIFDADVLCVFGHDGRILAELETEGDRNARGISRDSAITINGTTFTANIHS